MTTQLPQIVTKETEQIILSELRSMANQCYNWLNQARAYVNTQQSQMAQGVDFLEKKSQAFQSLSKFIAAYKNRRVAKNNLTSQNILLSGYQLLNQIGERIRGEVITYTLVLKSSKNQQIYSFQLPYGEFVKLVNISAHRITLKNSDTIIDKLLTVENNNINKDLISSEVWSEDKMNALQQFEQEIRSVERWVQVKNGYIIEAFLRKLKSENKFESNFSAMEATMKAPDIFFKGGDINNEQVKANYASVSNINTLIVHIEQTLTILTQNKEIRQDSIEKKLRQHSILDKEEQFINKEIENVLQELIQKFTPSIQR